MIRKIYGTLIEEGSWRKKINNEIEQILEKQNIVRFIKAKRIRWLGYEQRMNEERMPKRIMCARIKVTRRLRRPRSI